jgi:acyl carrier protein
MMTSNQKSYDTLTALKGILISVSGAKLTVEEISDTANPYYDGGLDSVSVLDFILAIEERFGITLVDDRLDSAFLKDLSLLASFIDGAMGRTSNKASL